MLFYTYLYILHSFYQKEKYLNYDDSSLRNGINFCKQADFFSCIHHTVKNGQNSSCRGAMWSHCVETQSEKKAKMGTLLHMASKMESLDHSEPFFLSSPRRSIQRVPQHDDSFQMVLASALPFHNHHIDSLITAFSKG